MNHILITSDSVIHFLEIFLWKKLIEKVLELFKSQDVGSHRGVNDVSDVDYLRQSF